MSPAKLTFMYFHQKGMPHLKYIREEIKVPVRNLNLELPEYETAKLISWPTSRHSLIEAKVILYVKTVGNM